MSSSAIRMRKLRNKLRDNEELYEKTNDKEWKRQKAIHDQRKLERQNNEDKTDKYQEYERKRKAGQWLKKKINAVDGRKLRGLKRRMNNEKKKAEEIKMLQVKVGELTNQKLDQQSSRTALGIKKPTDIVTPKETNPFPVTPEGSVASIIWDQLSPTSKKKSSRKMALSSKASTAKHKLRKHLGTRLDKVVVRVRKTITLADQIETFMLSDENPIKCPDKKKEHLRYRLTYLHVLHEKFLTEYKVDCSYSSFCKFFLSNIVKPKPQD